MQVLSTPTQSRVKEELNHIVDELHLTDIIFHIWALRLYLSGV